MKREILRFQIAGIGPLHHCHPGIIPDLPVQLPVPHINGIYMGCTALKQHIGKAAGGGAQVHGHTAPGIHPKDLQGFLQFQRPAADKGNFRLTNGELRGLFYRKRRFPYLNLSQIDIPCHNHGLCLLTACGQSSGNQSHIRTHFLLIRHAFILSVCLFYPTSPCKRSATLSAIC